jgi:hypothetical protein
MPKSVLEPLLDFWYVDFLLFLHLFAFLGDVGDWEDILDDLRVVEMDCRLNRVSLRRMGTQCALASCVARLAT